MGAIIPMERNLGKGLVFPSSRRSDSAIMRLIMHFRTRRSLCFLIPLLLLAAPIWAAQGKFLRYVEDGRGGGALQAAIVTLKNPDGVTVHLVAAVHIADRAYYERLNDLFKKDDAVLYEMVKPKGMAPPRPGEATGSAISMIQRFLKDALKLDFQLDDINYAAPNFVHADLDAGTFFRLQRQRGESMLSLMLNMMLQNLLNPPETTAPPMTLNDLIGIFTEPDGARQAKIILAQQFSDIDRTVTALQGTVLLTARNEAAVAALKKAIANGRKNIAVFFGAAHMPGIEQLMEDEMEFKQTNVQWHTAWDLTTPGATTQPAAPADE